VTSTGARLRAEINPNGASTTYRFEYLTVAAYEANPEGDRFAGAKLAPTSGAAGIGTGTTTITVAQTAQGLTLNTSYRYRPVATNVEGLTPGPTHTFTTNQNGSAFRLPDSRGWEMVTPADKGGGAIAPPETLFGGGDFQAAAAADALTYGSATSFGNGSGAPPASQYLSRRGTSGWVTENISAPLESSAYGDEPDGVPYRVFSGDLSVGLLFGGLACRTSLPGCPAPNPVLPGSGAPPNHMAYYLRDSATGSFTSLLDEADLAHTAVDAEHFSVSFAGATPDLRHIVLSSCAALTANASETITGPGECDASAQNLYEWSEGSLEAVNVLPGETLTTPGAVLAAPAGAISTGGSRVYFGMLEDGPLYLREAGEPDAKLLGESVGGGAAFQVASDSGAVAFFTKGSGLHSYSASSESGQALAAGVAGVLGASADGSTVYFQDAAGLQKWHLGATTTVTPGADATDASNYPPATGTARVSADGGHLAFLSDAAITDYDNADANSGEPDTEVYLWGPPPGGAAAKLVCASCNPAGERARGPSTIPGAQANGSIRAYKPRALSSNGNRLFFDSADKLVAGDTNAAPDVYEWEAQGIGDCTRSPGCVSLISSGRDSRGGSFVDASAGGSNVYFITGESLVNGDPGSIDIYDARVGGGFVEPQEPIACIGDACQALPSPPEDPTPGTLVPNDGNPRLRYFRPHIHKRHRHKKHKPHHQKGRHRHARALGAGR
jgi:hypothetical protein